MSSTAELASLAVLEFSVALVWSALAWVIAAFAASIVSSGLNVDPAVDGVDDAEGGNSVPSAVPVGVSD